MCHGKYQSNKTIRYKTDKPKHVNAKPYVRQKNKDYSDYEN